MKFFGNGKSHHHISKLRDIPIFHTLTRKELLEVEELLHDRVYERNEIIFEKGDPGHGIFVILSGKVRVSPCSEVPASALVELGPGDVVGELSLFDEIPRLATLVAAERTETVALFQPEFATLLTTNKNIGVKVLVEVARQLGDRTRKLLLNQTHTPTV